MITIDPEDYVSRLGYEFEDNIKTILNILFLVAMELTTNEVVAKFAAAELTFLLGWEEAEISRVWFVARSLISNEQEEIKEVIELITARVRNSKGS